MKYDVVGIGGLYLDVIARVSYDFTQAHNIILDREQELSANALPAVLRKLGEVDYAAGGSVSNSLAGISALGSLTGIFGKVAQDGIGDFLRHDLASRNIGLCCPPQDSSAVISPLCMVFLTPNGERSIVFNRSCAASFSKEDFTSFDFSMTQILLIEADLLRDLQAQKNILDAAGEARRRQSRVVLNLQGFDDWKHFPDLPGKIIALTDIIVGNEEESTAFSNYVTGNINEDQIFISTRGDKGVTAYAGRKTITLPAIPPSKFVSAIGAGDQFLAGFIKGVLDHGTLQDSLHLGIQTATRILEETGGRLAAPGGSKKLPPINFTMES